MTPYTHATYWTDKAGLIWVAYNQNGKGRDLAMCVLKPWEVARSISWAKSQKLIIEDYRS
jgi:hypothetical protein